MLRLKCNKKLTNFALLFSKSMARILSASYFLSSFARHSKWSAAMFFNTNLTFTLSAALTKRFKRKRLVRLLNSNISGSGYGGPVKSENFSVARRWSSLPSSPSRHANATIINANSNLTIHSTCIQNPLSLPGTLHDPRWFTHQAANMPSFWPMLNARRCKSLCIHAAIARCTVTTIVVIISIALTQSADCKCKHGFNFGQLFHRLQTRRDYLKSEF